MEVIIVEDQPQTKETLAIDICPETGNEHLKVQEGHCSYCILCGWSACSL